MRHFIHCAIAVCGLAFAAADAAADTALQSGVAASLSVPGSNFVPNLYIDVDGTAKALTVNLTGSGGDLDLFLRYGSPFPEQNPSVSYPTVTEDLLNRYAHYHAVSSSANESIAVFPSSRVPLKAGRWYIAVANSSATPATGSITAKASTTAPLGSIVLDFTHPTTDSTDPKNSCDTGFWTDSTPVTPVGGNTGTTLGQQRQNALNYAATQLTQQLQIPVNITVHACGAHLGGSSSSAVLAHAAPLYYLLDEPAFPLNALPKKYTWYPISAAARLGGVSACGLGGGDCNGTDGDEIEATFNEDIGQSTIIGGENFYLGFDPDTSHNSLDFVTIAMHEMTHGLGFFGLVNLDSGQGPIGAKAGISKNSIAFTNLDSGPYDDIYDDSVAIVNGSTYTPFMGYEVDGADDAARAAALVSGPVVSQSGQYNPGSSTGLRWSDPVAANATGINNLSGQPAPDDFPSLYAPCDKSSTTTCSTEPGSTLSHTIQAGDMMNAFYSGYNLRSMGLAVPMLAPVGWSNAAAASPTYGQPIPSNWYDRTHSGHGFDFELFAHDPNYGQDVYFLLFYTYKSDGSPEWYQAVGTIVDGVFLPLPQADGSTLYRVTYTTTPTSITGLTLDTSVAGSVVVDFNQASQSPACRNSDRSGAPQLAVMSWSIGSDTGEWCMEPIIPLASHATPDFNGHWYAPSDSGWGMEIIDVATTPAPTIAIYMYYPGPDNQPVWATASGTLVNDQTTMPLQQVSNGYCRTCPPPTQLTGSAIGSITLKLNTPAPGATPTGTATVTTNLPGNGNFVRNNIPIQMLSVPTGQ